MTDWRKKLNVLNEADEGPKLTRKDVTRIFAGFLDRLVKDHGNDRGEMFDAHLARLVGKTPSEALKSMPRGPKGRWQDLMSDIRDELKNFGKTNEAALNEYEQFTDENGITWNDEGDGSDRAGNQYRRVNGKIVRVNQDRFRKTFRPQQTQGPKLYHKVGFGDREAAKAEGMRWDPDAKKWYHSDSSKSAGSRFPKLTEATAPVDKKLKQLELAVRRLEAKWDRTGKSMFLADLKQARADLEEYKASLDPSTPNHDREAYSRFRSTR